MPQTLRYALNSWFFSPGWSHRPAAPFSALEMVEKGLGSRGERAKRWSRTVRLATLGTPGRLFPGVLPAEVVALGCLRLRVGRAPQRAALCLKPQGALESLLDPRCFCHRLGVLSPRWAGPGPLPLCGSSLFFAEVE